MGKMRSSNLELYRIFLMLAIVSHHYVVNSGLMPILYDEPLSFKSGFFYLFGMWGKTGINCFVLITGYFMCKSKITWRKFLKLILEVEFYKIVIFFIFYLAGYNSPTIKDFVFIFLPVGSVNVGFTSCFILFYLFIPFLTILVKIMSRKQHLLLIALCLFVYTILGMIPGIRVSYNYVSWFCILFLIASYVRFYGIPIKGKKKWGMFFGISTFVSMVSVIGFVFLKKDFHIPIPCYWLVSDSYAIMAIVVAICGLMYFKDLKIPQSKIINTIASSVFGVLLIHANSDMMRQWLWKDTVNVIGQYNSDYCYLLAIVSVLAIFIICVIIDQIRIKLFEKPLFKLIDGKISCK